MDRRRGNISEREWNNESGGTEEGKEESRERERWVNEEEIFVKERKKNYGRVHHLLLFKY